MSERLAIVRADDAGNLRVKLWFFDGVVQTVDVGQFIRENPHPQYNDYLDPKRFGSFRLENGNVVWGESWDLVFPVVVLHQGVAAGEPAE